MLNLVSALELTLYNGRRPVTGDEVISFESGDPAQFKSFEDFWEAFKKQLQWLIEQEIQLNEYFGLVHQEIMPSPLLSAFFEGPVQKGKDLIFGGALYNASGATHIGFADTVDSLSAIEKAVFIDRICSFDELLKALIANFEGYDKLHAYLVHRAPKYGTDDPIAIKNSRNLIRFLFDTYQSHTNYRGGKYRPAFWSTTNHAGQGKMSGALPNGRKAFTAFASGITPVSQAAPELTTCMRTVGGLDGLCIPGGEALNLKLAFIKDTADVQRFGAAIEAYFRSGGLHVQFNIMSYEMLIDAKKNPENYPELLVRVSGYSAYFKDLNETMKDEIITRTEYDIITGKANPFPDA
jgi:formate C-acetyltransferase